jgi:fructosamine-3-kinase
MTPFLDDAVESVPLVGGTHHSGWLLTQADGSRQVVKTTPDVPEGMFEAEAEGLTVLRDSGAVGAPRVIDVGADFLVIEVLNPLPGFDDARFWEQTGRALARLHSVSNDRFGWHRDNWLGPTRQFNAWTDDCYARVARVLELLHLRELLCVVSQGGRDWALKGVLRLIRRYG